MARVPRRSAPPERLGGGEEVFVQIEWAPASREPLVGARVWPGGLGAVRLEGQPVGAELRIDPDPVALGAGPLGCSRVAALRVVNDGQRPLEVHGLSTALAGLSVVLPESAGPLPWTRMSGDDVQVELQSTAEVDAPFLGVLTVASSDPLAPELAAAVGRAAPAGDDAADRFVQPSAVERDLLLSRARAASWTSSTAAPAGSTATSAARGRAHSWPTVSARGGCGASSRSARRRRRPACAQRWRGRPRAGGAATRARRPSGVPRMQTRRPAR